MNTPVLFLIFNRPDQTKKVFASIRQARPKQLFIAGDGPRKEREQEATVCSELRVWIVEHIDWDCEVKTRFQETNLGCGKHVSSAITWFFENVESGIILEDDCLPATDFFPFVNELLDRYRTDQSIMMISGSNFVSGNSSYYLSAYGHIWGWATWRRAWELYKFNMEAFDEERIFKNLSDIGFDETQIDHERRIFSNMAMNKIDTWDYQWHYSVWQNGGFSINPSKNLISNIGFDESGTHTNNFIEGISNRKIESLRRVKHPKSLSYNAENDKRLFYQTNLFVSRKTEDSWVKKVLTRALDSFRYRVLKKT